MSFLQKSNGDYSEIEKHVLVTTSYEGLDDNEELGMFPVVNQNNYYQNLFSDSKSESDSDETEENAFDDDIDKVVEATPKTTVNTKVVQEMKKLQAL